MAAASLNLWASRVDTKLTYLKKNIRVSDDLLDALMAEELITYDEIRFKGPDSFERFCNGLKTAGKHLVMEELTREEGESQGLKEEGDSVALEEWPSKVKDCKEESKKQAPKAGADELVACKEKSWEEEAKYCRGGKIEENERGYSTSEMTEDEEEKDLDTEKEKAVQVEENSQSKCKSQEEKSVVEREEGNRHQLEANSEENKASVQQKQEPSLASFESEEMIAPYIYIRLKREEKKDYGTEKTGEEEERNFTVEDKKEEKTTVAEMEDFQISTEISYTPLLLQCAKKKKPAYHFAASPSTRILMTRVSHHRDAAPEHSDKIGAASGCQRKVPHSKIKRRCAGKPSPSHRNGRTPREEKAEKDHDQAEDEIEHTDVEEESILCKLKSQEKKSEDEHEEVEALKPKESSEEDSAPAQLERMDRDQPQELAECNRELSDSILQECGSAAGREDDLLLPQSLYREPVEVASATLETLIKKEGRLLGSRSFGDVFLARLQLYSEKEIAVAVKKFKPPKDNKPSRMLRNGKQFSAEIQALARCRHPNVVKLLAYCVDGPELSVVYELITGGTLREALSKKNEFPLSVMDRLHIAQDASCALDYLHRGCNLIHRDIKTTNMLLTGDKTVKLADFGLATFNPGEESFYVTSSVGTRAYMPPEAFKGKVTEKADVYAFAMVLYELVTGLPPYSCSKKTDLITYMKDLEEEGEKLTVMIDPRALWPEKVACQLFEFAKQCSAIDRKQRPSMKEVSEEIERILARFHP